MTPIYCAAAGEVGIVTRLTRWLFIGCVIMTGASCGYLARSPESRDPDLPAAADLAAASDPDAAADPVVVDDGGEGFLPVALHAPGGAFDTLAPGRVPPSSAPNDRTGPLDTGALELQVFELVNHQRQTHGLQPLRFSPALARAALGHSRAMAERGFFEHRGADEPGLPQRVRASGEHTDRIGENLFKSTGHAADGLAADCVTMWMWSPGHRINLLDPAFAKTGIAIGRSPDGQSYITEDFAR
jgi:uncharacterized protein YkwD